jgi:hypothetical protein
VEFLKKFCLDITPITKMSWFQKHSANVLAMGLAFFFFFFLKSNSFFFKDLFIITCKYTVAVFRHSRRGSQISLQRVVSHHVVAGIWTPDLQKSSQVLLPTEPSHQPPYYYFLNCSLWHHLLQPHSLWIKDLFIDWFLSFKHLFIYYM